MTVSLQEKETDTLYRAINILLVDDSPTDVMLTQEALLDSRINNHLIIANNGEEALTFLNGETQFPHGRSPDLILLDLNMPKMDGRELLKRLKSQERTKRVPVIILTTSKAEEDILRSYDLNANCYITKPVDFEKFCKVIKSIGDFWITIVTLPGDKN